MADAALAYAEIIAVHRSGIQFHPVYNGMSSGLDVGVNVGMGMLIFNESFATGETVFVIYREGSGEVIPVEPPLPPEPTTCDVPAGLVVTSSGGKIQVTIPSSGTYFIAISPPLSACGEDVIQSTTITGSIWESATLPNGIYKVCVRTVCTPDLSSDYLSSEVTVGSIKPPPPLPGEESKIIVEAPSGSINSISPIIFFTSLPVNAGEQATFTHTGFTQSFTVNVSLGGIAERYIKILVAGVVQVCQLAVNGNNVLPSVSAASGQQVVFTLTNIPC